MCYFCHQSFFSISLPLVLIYSSAFWLYSVEPWGYSSLIGYWPAFSELAVASTRLPGT